jgi:hypothetical protein
MPGLPAATPLFAAQAGKNRPKRILIRLFHFCFGRYQVS